MVLTRAAGLDNHNDIERRQAAFIDPEYFFESSFDAVADDGIADSF